jgi:uncharacterized YigZ family protein
MEDRYFTIASESSFELKIKNSRFLAESCLVINPDTAVERLSAIRKREYDATHHCYAYLTGTGSGAVFKYSDDGEPNGTAGKPIYDVLAGTKVTNCLVVVTRYYGGTKLGTGGLTHAYSDAAKGVLEQSGRTEHFLLVHFKLDLEFSTFDKWQRVLARLGATTLSSEFADRVGMHLAIRQSRAEELKREFIELTSGRGIIEEITG